MVFGPLGMNIDVVGKNLVLPPIEVGARLWVHPVGAHDFTRSTPCIALRSAVSLVRPDGSHHLIRRAEVLDDLTGPERVPAFLACGPGPGPREGVCVAGRGGAPLPPGGDPG